MRRSLPWLGAAVGAVLAVALAVRGWPYLLYYWRLFHAQRLAQRFYAACPTLSKSLPFRADSPRTLDIYQPALAGPHPVVVYVYGGSWNSGHKELYAPAAQRLLPEGLVVVVPDYTPYPASGFPHQSAEVAAALAWTFDHIADYGGDPQRVILVAQSAGAQIALLALLDPRFLAAYGHTASPVVGFIGLSGVYDMATQLAYERQRRRAEQYVANVIGGRHNAAAASPQTLVGPRMPPALLIHGDADTTVPLEMSRLFHQRLRQAGVPSQFVVYQRSGHSGLLFDALTHNPSRLFTDMLAFIRQRTATTPPSPAPRAGPNHPGPAIGA